MILYHSMNTITLKLNDNQIEQLRRVYKDNLIPNTNQYVLYTIKDENVTITVYTSKKAVFQGKDAHIYASGLMAKEKAMAGSDEVGTGDYFGPIIVCACIVEEEDYSYLRSINVDDSKKINDEYIMKIGPELMSRLKHSLLILNNKQYNEVHKTFNLNQIKAKLHNQAYINMQNKGYKIPSAAYVDQFEEESLYFKHLINEKEVYHRLTFETKAESKYIAVACASIIARYAFLRSIENLNNKYQFEFIKGASDLVDEAAIKFVNKYGFNELNNVAKIHFKNTEKVLEKIKKA